MLKYVHTLGTNYISRRAALQGRLALAEEGVRLVVGAVLLVEPAVIDRLGIVEREMVDFQNETSPEARGRREDPAAAAEGV